MKKFQFAIVLLVIFMGIHASSFSQKRISELTQDMDKFWKGWTPINAHKSSGKPYKAGQGVVAYYPALQVPKKIALISFYVYDFGSAEFHHFGNYRTLGWEQNGSKSWQLTEEGAKKVANLFYYSWINEEKKNSLAQGVELITPDQFSSQQQTIYNDFQNKVTAFGMWVTQEDNTGTVMETADGFKPILCGAPGDYKGAEALGLLAKDLGVDAVMLVVTEVNSGKEGTALKAVGMYVYGPNPVPREEGKKYIGFNGAGRQEGNVYQLIKIKFAGDKGVLFYITDKKTKETTLDIAGIDKVYSNILGGIFYQLKEVHKCGQAEK